MWLQLSESITSSMYLFQRLDSIYKPFKFNVVYYMAYKLFLTSEVDRINRL
jgi:hypothetical protein